MEENKIEFKPTIVNYNGIDLTLYDQDMWFIQEIRKLGFGTLSNVEIQNGRITLVRKLEKKIKPGDNI